MAVLCLLFLERKKELNIDIFSVQPCSMTWHHPLVRFWKLRKTDESSFRFSPLEAAVHFRGNWTAETPHGARMPRSRQHRLSGSKQEGEKFYLMGQRQL
jgi:hypothetical protein